MLRQGVPMSGKLVKGICDTLVHPSLTNVFQEEEKICIKLINTSKI